jgi:GNAT superfamily N-acetyltransferase
VEEPLILSAMKIIEVKSIKDQLFIEAMEIYDASFPRSERHARSIIEERMDRKLYRLFIGQKEGKTVLMALFYPLKGSQFILFDYMAVVASYRGKGLGSQFLNAISSTIGLGKRHLLLEVEDPRSGDNKDQRRKRLEFYKRQGAKELKGLRYLMPPLFGPTPTEMVLLVWPDFKDGKIPGHEVKKIILQVYRELYGRDDKDPLLTSFIQEVPAVVELIGDRS